MEVAEYAFTIKLLSVCHCGYQYLRYMFQVADSLGTLDRPPAQRNTIQMHAATVLTHLICCAVSFVDLSSYANHDIEAQCQLFESLSPLFASKPMLVVANKFDLRPPKQPEQHERDSLQRVVANTSALSSRPSSAHASGPYVFRRHLSRLFSLFDPAVTTLGNIFISLLNSGEFDIVSDIMAVDLSNCMRFINAQFAAQSLPLNNDVMDKAAARGLRSTRGRCPS